MLCCLIQRLAIVMAFAMAIQQGSTGTNTWQSKGSKSADQIGNSILAPSILPGAPIPGVLVLQP